MTYCSIGKEKRKSLGVSWWQHSCLEGKVSHSLLYSQESKYSFLIWITAQDWFLKWLGIFLKTLGTPSVVWKRCRPLSCWLPETVAGPSHPEDSSSIALHCEHRSLKSYTCTLHWSSELAPPVLTLEPEVSLCASSGPESSDYLLLSSGWKVISY